MPPARASHHIDLTDPAGRMDRLVRELHAFSADNHLPENVVQDVHLALDEIVSNIVRHGGVTDGVRHISVDLAVRGNELDVHVKDDATPFDPLQMPAPDPSLPLSDRPIGGLGIHLVRALMTEVRYRHEDGMNHLAMTKRWL